MMFWYMYASKPSRTLIKDTHNNTTNDSPIQNLRECAEEEGDEAAYQPWEDLLKRVPHLVNKGFWEEKQQERLELSSSPLNNRHS